MKEYNININNLVFIRFRQKIHLQNEKLLCLFTYNIIVLILSNRLKHNMK